MSNHTETTIDWYINWLAESRPDLTLDQRIEMATGFVSAQQPPAPAPPVAEDDANMVDINEREQQRAEARKRKYLTSKELADVLKAPGDGKVTK